MGHRQLCGNQIVGIVINFDGSYGVFKCAMLDRIIMSPQWSLFPSVVGAAKRFSWVSMVDILVFSDNGVGAPVEAQRSAAALLPFVYDDMHRVAPRERRRVSARATQQTTALVHEAYLKLLKEWVKARAWLRRELSEAAPYFDHKEP